MRYIDFDGEEIGIYGYEMVWQEEILDENWDVAHTIEHSQFFLESEYDKAVEIASRFKCRNHTVSLRFLTEDFKRMFAYEVNLDD